MARKRERWPAPEVEGLLPGLQSPDEEARGDAVRALCPCRAGWGAFEAHVGEVLRRLRDPSRAVRAQALHVLEDADRMRLGEEIGYYLEEREARLGEKRVARSRSIAERSEARRTGRRERRRGRA